MTEKELYVFLKTKFIEAGGVTEKQAAEMIGITQSTFNKRIKNGSLKYLEVLKIMETLGYKVEWIKKIDNKIVN